MKNRIKEFFRNIVTTIKMAPAESAVIFFFFVFLILILEKVFQADDSRLWAYLALYPFAFTLAFVLNRWLPSGPGRWLYYLSPLMIVPFFWLDMSCWVETPSFRTALGICPAIIFLCRWRRDNGMFIGDMVHYVKNGIFAGALSAIAFALVTLIYFSLDYIFPSLPLGREEKTISYFAVIFYAVAMPLIFLTFNYRQRDEYRPLLIVDTLVNYVLTPALMIYTAILYAYFIKILVTWTLPAGGIAYMVFAFTMTAIAVKAYAPLMSKILFGWFHARFHLISMPALLMFWIGVGRRVTEYGLTFDRVYLLICGAVMTFTVLMFFVPGYARYLYTVAMAVVLFSAVAFFPGITAEEIAVGSQKSRFEKLASELGMLDTDGMLIVEKLPDADSLQAKSYEQLYESFSYLYRELPNEELKKMYGIADMKIFNDSIMPSNVSYGYYHGDRYDEYDSRYAYINLDRFDIEIGGFASLHKVEYTWDGQSGGGGYSYKNDSDTLRIYSPSDSLLFEEPYADIMKKQIAKMDIIRPGATPRMLKEELESRAMEMLVYDRDRYRIVFSYANINIGEGFELNNLGVEFILVRE